jgi:hypothetical protein
MHMPRSSIPVVSPSLALALRGLQPSGVLKPSAFPDSRPAILMDHNQYLFGTQSRGLHTRYTWLHTHPYGYARRFARDLVANLLSWELGPRPHPLGNNIQFHGFHSDPKDLGLT